MKRQVIEVLSGKGNTSALTTNDLFILVNEVATDVFVTGGTYSSGTTVFTNNTGGTFNVTGFYVPPTTPVTTEKIILKTIELGTRNLGEPVGLSTNLYDVFRYRLTDGFITSPRNINYNGVKFDYYFTYNDPNTGIRTKVLWTTDTFGVSFDPSQTFTNMSEYLCNNYEQNTLVNFYCDMYLELKSIYSPPTQVRLTNPLFNSLNPYKYSKYKSYIGISEFVRSNYNSPISLNSIESNFINDWVYYYNVTTSQDIVKKVYDIVSTSEFYGSLSGQSQEVLLVSPSIDSISREVIKNSVFVETLTSFYSKFKIPVNEHGFYESCNNLYNNFYGDKLYDIVGGSPNKVSSFASIDGNLSSSFYQMIDTYRLYPSGTPGLIYYNDNENDTRLNSLSTSMGINNKLKYIGKRDHSYVQVLPYYQDVYILKLSVLNNNDPLLFINYLVENYLQINDSSLKTEIGDNTNINKYWRHGNTLTQTGGLYYLNSESNFNNNPYGPYLVIQSTDEKMYQLSQNPIFNGNIKVEAIYKGKSFKPSIYPLNLNQLTFEVPVTSENNQFYMDGTKQLRLIVKYTKLQKYDIITTDIVVTNIRGSLDNRFFTVTTTTGNFEKIIYESISYGKRKQIRPGSVEIYLSFFDTLTNESSSIPNYKIIVSKYGDNEVFKLIRGSFSNQ